LRDFFTKKSGHPGFSAAQIFANRFGKFNALSNSMHYKVPGSAFDNYF
jgi:hypothetical protein